MKELCEVSIRSPRAISSWRRRASHGVVAAAEAAAM